MNNEELVNLNMKEVILNKWKSKLSYPFNSKDLEELENIINYYEQENNRLKEQKKELRSWLEKEIIDSKAGDSQCYRFGRVLSKLTELEEGKNDSKRDV